MGVAAGPTAIEVAGQATTRRDLGRQRNDLQGRSKTEVAATAQGRGHYGGRMAFDPAGYLFLTA